MFGMVLDTPLNYHDNISYYNSDINPSDATDLFRYSCKHQKAYCFLRFSGGIKRDLWHEMVWYSTFWLRDPNKKLNGHHKWVINQIFQWIQDCPSLAILKSFTTTIFYYVGQTPPETCSGEIKKKYYLHL